MPLSSNPVEENDLTLPDVSIDYNHIKMFTNNDYLSRWKKIEFMKHFLNRC